MESAVLWKAAMRPRLPTGLGKRRQKAVAVSHSSHSPYHWKQKALRQRRRIKTFVSIDQQTNAQRGDY